MENPNSVSTIRHQILWNRLLALVEEQAQVLIRTAFSPLVRACGDVSVGVFDLSGRMLVRKNYNQLPAGQNILSFTAPGQGRNVYFLAMKVDGKIVYTKKILQEK